MTELLNLQKQFQCYLLTGQQGIEESIVATANVSIETRLGIYKDGYKLRLIESLTTNYEGLHQYLGTEEFNTLCSAYIDAHPSVFRSIRWYGDQLPQFLKHFYEKKHAYLVELAEFEWNMTLAFDAADDPIVSLDEMARVPPDAWAGLQFKPHSSLHRVNYFWNTIPLWQTLIKDEDIPELNKDETPTPWIIWRSPDYQIRFYSMSEQEAWAMDALLEGLSFGEICAGLCQWLEEEQVGMQAASYLKGWIQAGIISYLLISD